MVVGDAKNRACATLLKSESTHVTWSTMRAGMRSAYAFKMYLRSPEKSARSLVNFGMISLSVDPFFSADSFA